jgi:hypothetical protein
MPGNSWTTLTLRNQDKKEPGAVGAVTGLKAIRSRIRPEKLGSLKHAVDCFNCFLKLPEQLSPGVDLRKRFKLQFPGYPR